MKPDDSLLPVGGQAVIEGVMMRSPRALAIAVRLADGTVFLKDEPYASLGERYPLLKKPILRGPVTLIEALVTGVQALTFSAQAALEEEEKKLGWGALLLTLGGAFALTFLLFGFLPHYLSFLLGALAGRPLSPADFTFEISFVHPYDDRNLTIEAPLDTAFRTVLERLPWQNIALSDQQKAIFPQVLPFPGP